MPDDGLLSSHKRPSVAVIHAIDNFCMLRFKTRLLTGKLSGVPLECAAQMAWTGQTVHEGRLVVQSVAPKSITPCV